MANPEHVALLKLGAEVWNKWRAENPHVAADLTSFRPTPDSFPLTAGGLIDLRGLHFNPAVMDRTVFEHVDLSDSDLSGIVLQDCFVSRSSCDKTSFKGADLRGGRIRLSTLAEVNMLRVTLREVDLHGSDLSQATLRECVVTRSSFTKASLRGADLSGSRVRLSDFENVNLENAHPYGAELRKCSLQSAALRNANLGGATLFRCNLDGSDFAGAVMGDTNLLDLNMSGVVGFDKVLHAGPSSIGLDTMLRSNGRIPEVFLRGCGVPDSFSDYAASLVGKPFDFCSCFISYSTKDQEFAQRLHADLQAKGVRCWIAPEDLKIGDKFRTTIDETIRVYDKLLLVISEHSVQSDWVEKEVETAMEKEREQKRTMLFPIRLDAAVMDIKTGWPADIRRTRHIGDFTSWKDHAAYQNAFDCLIEDLKAMAEDAR